jgi:hypothetical protein
MDWQVAIVAWMLIGAAVYMTIARLRPSNEEWSAWGVICVFALILLWPVLAFVLYSIRKGYM